MTSPLPTRIAILGCNGYLGSRLAQQLSRAPEVRLVLGVGRRPAEPSQSPKVSYVRGDLTELPLVELFTDHAVQAICHCAFISKPLRNEREAYRCNVVATERVFAAAAAAGVSQAILLSSMAVYGPRSTPLMLSEDEPLLPNEFVFARHKLLQEQVALEELRRSQCALTVVRPCTVVGPRANNFLLRFLMRSVPPVPVLGDPQWQFLHEDDFVHAVLGLLRTGLGGAYNMTPDDAVSLRQAVRLLGGTSVAVPRRLLVAGSVVSWRLRLPFVPAPPAALDFLRQPPLGANTRLSSLVCYPLRSSREALLSVRSRKGSP